MDRQNIRDFYILHKNLSMLSSHFLSKVTKLQKEIDKESENKNELLRLENETIDPAHKEACKKKLAKSDEKVEAMMMMMLHYCAGLQYCLDHENEEKRRLLNQEETISIISTESKQSGSSDSDYTVDPLGACVKSGSTTEDVISIKSSGSGSQKPEIMITMSDHRDNSQFLHSKQGCIEPPVSVIDQVTGDSEQVEDYILPNFYTEKETEETLLADEDEDEASSEDEMFISSVMSNVPDCLKTQQVTGNISETLGSESECDIFEEFGATPLKSKNDMLIDNEKDCLGMSVKGEESDMLIGEGEDLQVHFGVADNSLHTV